ncbi:MAG: hypothetical protein IJI24_08920, partial [Lachnospiraceae bacterium]|nr:hypothetical protein [Lachnospiraceae bacterium]
MKFTSYLGGMLERNPLPPLGLGEHAMQLAVPVVVMTLGDHKSESVNLIRTLLQDRLEEADAVCFENLQDVLEDLITDDIQAESRDSFLRREAFGRIDCARLKERLSAMADRLHNELGEYSFQGKGTVRITLLVRAEDSMAGSLQLLVRAIRECYTAYFMSQCIIEAFVFLDQRAFFDERADERYAGLYQTLKDAQDLRRGHVLDAVFVLSNMNSLEVMDDENEREGYLCVGYEILATTEVQAWRNRTKGLNLTIFQQKIDNANLGNDIEGGLLYSLGYRHLEQDHELVLKSMCCGVLEELGQSGEATALNPAWLENEIKRCMPAALNPSRDLKKLFRDLKTEETQLH